MDGFLADGDGENRSFTLADKLGVDGLASGKDMTKNERFVLHLPAAG